MSYKEVPPEDVAEKGAAGTKIRWLITGKDGAPNFAMRLFEMAPGGYSPLHAHPWEHEVFVLRGRGLVVRDGSYVRVGPGDFLFIRPNEKHQFRNDRRNTHSFNCLIPIQKG